MDQDERNTSEGSKELSETELETVAGGSGPREYWCEACGCNRSGRHPDH